MRKWYTYIIMLATVLFGSCNLEDTLFPEQECETEKEAVNVRLILSMMEGRGLSRAPLTDTPTSETYLDEEPLGNEYYINPYDVEVLIFNANTNVFVERATMVRATPTDNYHEYQLDGTLTEVNGETNYHVVLLANLHGSSYCNNFTTPTTGTTMSTFLEGLTYTSYNAAFTGKLLEEDSTERIPMWGITTTKLTDGTTIRLNLLRSMAKIRVNLELEADGYTLSKVTLNNANPGGFFTPSMEKGITTAGITANVSEVRIPEGLTQLESLAFEKVDDSYIIYVPECYTFSEDNEGAKTAETYITVELKDNGGNVVDLEGNDKLYFREYRATDETAGIVNGSFFDIVRNYFYDYTITAVNTSSEEVSLNIQYQVMGWTSVTNPNLTFGNDYGNVLEGESASPDPSNDNGTGTETGDASEN